MRDWINYLQSPYLVVKIQEYYGIQTSIWQNEYETKGKLKRSDSDLNESISSDSDSEIKSHIITKKFWYYLFIVGTALGDEIFYASFIPFWFWNIDGAVGRRVVLVWTIIMYIGNHRLIFFYFGFAYLDVVLITS